MDGSTESLKPDEIKEIIATFKEVLGVDNLAEVKAEQLYDVLEPEALLERFAAKKANRVSRNNDFITMKGKIKGQIENDQEQLSIENSNEFIGFKCLHYSVTESAG